MKWAIAISVILGCAWSGRSADWNQFSGPNRDNISTEEGLLAAWPEDGPELIWARSGFGEGYSSVAVSEGTIYTAGMVGADMVVVALNLDGDVKWKAGNETGQLMCVAFKTGETVYARFTSDRKRKGAITWADGMLYGYDEGGEVWIGAADPEHFEVTSRFNLPSGSGYHWAHPVVSGGRLYIRHGDFLHAYDVNGE